MYRFQGGIGAFERFCFFSAKNAHLLNFLYENGYQLEFFFQIFIQAWKIKRDLLCINAFSVLQTYCWEVVSICQNTFACSLNNGYWHLKMKIEGKHFTNENKLTHVVMPSWDEKKKA